MTPESIITNCLEQALRLKCNSLVCMVAGPKTIVFAKTLAKQVPLFEFPTDRFYSASNLLFQQNSFEETKHMKFNPDATLQMVRIQTDLVRKATQGKDLLLSTALTGRTRYQVLWYIDLPRETLKEFEDCSNTMKFEHSTHNAGGDSESAAINHELRTVAAEQAQQDYEEYLAFMQMFDIWEYADNSQYPTLSSGDSYFAPYLTIELYVE